MFNLNKLIVGVFILILFAGCLSSPQESRVIETDSLKEVIIAETGTSPPGLLIYIALDQGFFEEEGLNVKLTTEYAHGIANLDAINNGDIFVGTASETPFMRAGFKDYDVSAIATIGKADRHLAVVGRKDRGITAPSDIEGKKIGVTIGSNAEYFLDLFSLSADVNTEDIKKVHVKPIEMADYLESGKVDAIVSWYPNWKNAEIAVGENSVTFHGEGIYTVYFNLLASNDFIAENPDTVKSMLRALLKAEAYAKENPDETVKALAKLIGSDEERASEVIDNYDLKISLDQSLLFTLDEEARWLIKKGLTNDTKIPNYLDYIHLDSLNELDSMSVTMIYPR